MYFSIITISERLLIKQKQILSNSRIPATIYLWSLWDNLEGIQLLSQKLLNHICKKFDRPRKCFSDKIALVSVYFSEKLTWTDLTI